MKKKTQNAFRFTNIVLENWRNYAHVETALTRRVFLVGPNASGKSNFLDAFRFLRDIVSVGGGFQAAIQQTSRNGISKIRCLAARANSDVSIKACFGLEEEPALWEYEISFNQDSSRKPVLKKERVMHRGEEILKRPDSRDRKDPARLTQTYLEQVYANEQFREVADFFRSIQYLHIVPQLIREPDRSVGRNDDPFGGNFLEHIAGKPEKTRNSMLRRILTALRTAVPQLKELELWRDNRGIPHLRGNYEHWRPQGAWQTEEQFSDGTLRLMGLLWSLQEGTGPLLLEEPELSLHPDVVRYIPQMFARLQRRTGRQILISTHSSDLLKDKGIGLDEVLLLKPKKEGTSIQPASQIKDAVTLLEEGQSLDEIVIPHTRPADVEQLMLFGESHA